MVGDLRYLDQQETKDSDKALSRRIFLHARMLGMFDPQDWSRMVCAIAELPEELQRCLATLKRNAKADAQLRKFKADQEQENPIHAFCARYKLGPFEKRALLNGGAWVRPLMQCFTRKAGPGLPTLSLDGDHSLLFEQARHIVQRAGAESIEATLNYFIDERLWHQGLHHSTAAQEKVLAGQPLSRGWRRMVNEKSKEVFFLHESGRRERRRPVPDSDLPAGWLKLEQQSNPGQFIYQHFASRRLQLHRPLPQEDMPEGWERLASQKDPNKVFFLHRASGVVQLGRPCDGPPEDLPPFWEKVASSKKNGRPYYFNRASGESLHHPPARLPDGWRHMVSSQGKTYYWHRATGRAQFECPQEG